MRLLIIWLFLLPKLFADDVISFDFPEASVKFDKVFDQPENSFLQSAPDLFFPEVDPYSGRLSFWCNDFTVEGIQPLTVSRGFTLGPQESRTGYWDFNHTSHIGGNLELNASERFLAIGTQTGGILSLKPDAQGVWKHNSKGYCNFGMSGATHADNIKLSYHKVDDPKNKQRFVFTGELHEGDGSIRYFSSKMHAWHHKKEHTIKKNTILRAGSVRTYAYYPQVWTPYELDVLEERLPNGNWLIYEHESWQDEEIFPRPSRLKKVTAYNRDRTKILGWLEYHYSKGGLKVVGSDKRSAYYKIATKGAPYLLSSQVKGNPLFEYAYDAGDNLCQMKRAGVVIWKTTYDKEGRVVRQEKYGQLFATYDYKQDHTIVTDALGNKTLYYFDAEKRPTLTKYFEGETLKLQKRQSWCSKTGNLLEESLLDCEDKNLRSKQFTYDPYGNIIKEVLKNDHEEIIHLKEFSQDGFNLLLKETDPLGRITTYTYLPNTNLCTSKTSSYEGEVFKKETFAYDDAGALIQVMEEDAGFKKTTCISPKQQIPCLGLPEVVEHYDGQKTRFQYTSFGKVSKEEHLDSDGQHAFTIERFYDDNEHLISEKDAEGNITQFSCDSLGRLNLIFGPKPDNKRELIYDQADQIIKIIDRERDRNDLILTRDYDAKARLISESDACGNLTRYSYDAFDHLLQTIYPDESRTTLFYDPLGNMIKSEDEEGYSKSYGYNLLGKCSQCIRSDGTQELWSYDACGRETTHTLPTGLIVKTSYTPLDLPTLIQAEEPSGKILKKEKQVWEGSLLKEIHSPRGLVTHFIYNSKGQLIREECGERWTEKSYDALGRCSCIKNVEVQEIRSYDTLNRITREQTHNLSGEILSWKEYSYDPQGNITQEKTFDGAWEYNYDSLNNLIYAKDPLGHITRQIHTWNEKKCITTISPKGIQTILIFDCRDREMQKEIRDSEEILIYLEEKTYDKRGNLISQTLTPFKSKEAKTSFTHTWEYGPENHLEQFVEAGRNPRVYTYAQGLLSSMTKPDGKSIYYEYDSLGRKIRCFGEGVDEVYSYDEEDRPIQVGATQRCYNLHGDLIQENLGNGLIITHSYDSLGRCSDIQYPNVPTVHYNYKEGRLHRLEAKGNKHIYLERDQRGRITHDTHARYSWDALNRLTLKQSPHYNYEEPCFDGHGNLLHYRENGESRDYSYDDYDQLTSELEHDYGYDSLNNRTQDDGEPLSYDESHQRIDLPYDANGNLLNYNGWKFSYDILDRLISVKNANCTIAYAYDGFGRCLSKTVLPIKGKETQELYLWDDQREIGSYNESGRLKELQILGEYGQAVFIFVDGNFYIPIYDFRGNLSTIIPINKGKQEHYQYLAFLEEDTGGLAPWRFSGKRTDTHTGLVNFGQRLYVPTLGRWLTPDPLGFADGPNPYAYVHNHPLTAWDFEGLFERDPACPYSFAPPCKITHEQLIVEHLAGSTESLDRLFPLEPKEYSLNDLNPGAYKLHPKLRFCYINGMNTDYNEALSDARFLSKLAGDYNIAGAHNPTYDRSGDIYRCLLEVIYKTEPKNIRAQGPFLRRQMASLPEGGALVTYCYSEGAIIGRTVAAKLPPNYRDKLHIIAICPGRMMEKDLGKSVVNICAGNLIRDPVALTARLLMGNKSRYNIINADSHPDDPGFNRHGLQNKTYEEPIILQTIEILKKYQ